MTSIQSTLLTACQLQVVLTWNDPFPPVLLVIAEFGLSVNVQLAAACSTETVCRAIVSEPVRVVASRFSSTRMPTVPSLVPDWPNETVTHATLLRAVHAQPPRLTSTVNCFASAASPVAGSEKLVGETT